MDGLSPEVDLSENGWTFVGDDPSEKWMDFLRKLISLKNGWTFVGDDPSEKLMDFLRKLIPIKN